jgi:hypothetical protein
LKTFDLFTGGTTKTISRVYELQLILYLHVFELGLRKTVDGEQNAFLVELRCRISKRFFAALEHLPVGGRGCRVGEPNPLLRVCGLLEVRQALLDVRVVRPDLLLVEFRLSLKKVLSNLSQDFSE